MNWIQKKLIRYHHGYYMGAGLALALVALAWDYTTAAESLKSYFIQSLIILGALLLGYGTGICDQKACQNGEV